MAKKQMRGMTAAEHLKFASALHQMRADLQNMYRFVCSRLGHTSPAAKELFKAIKYFDGPNLRSHMEDELYRHGEAIPMRDDSGIAYGLRIYYPGPVTEINGDGEKWFAGLADCTDPLKVSPLAQGGAK